MHDTKRLFWMFSGIFIVIHAFIFFYLQGPVHQYETIRIGFIPLEYAIRAVSEVFYLLGLMNNEKDLVVGVIGIGISVILVSMVYSVLATLLCKLIWSSKPPGSATG